MSKKYRVLRVLEYVGDLEWIENTLNRSSVPLNGDSRHISGAENYIKSAMIGNFPEDIKELEQTISQAEEIQNNRKRNVFYNE